MKLCLVEIFLTFVTRELSLVPMSDCAATHSGHKVRSIMLPVEIQISLFFRNVSNPDSTWKETNPLHAWNGMSLDREDGSFHELNANYRRLRGTLSWENLPREIKQIQLQGNHFEGHVDCSYLPLNSSLIYLNHNHFTGSIDLTSLPALLVYFCLNSNYFSGELNFNHLPLGLQWLWLHRNQFTGIVQLDNIPKTMTEILLKENKFIGVLDLRVLPNCLTF